MNMRFIVLDFPPKDLKFCVDNDLLKLQIPSPMKDYVAPLRKRATFPSRETCLDSKLSAKHYFWK